MDAHIRVVIVDDENLARDLIRVWLKDFPMIDVVAECCDGFSALKTINELKPDLLFLDIQMPKLNGFEMLEVLDYMPNVIFSTAFHDYAIKAFELNAVDYLLKPYSKQRFAEAVEKAIDRISMDVKDEGRIRQVIEMKDDYEGVVSRVVVKTGSKIKMIHIEDVKYIAAQDDYVMIYTQDGHHLKEKTMKYFESHLDPTQFVRVHRSYILAVDQLSQIELMGKESYVATLKDGKTLPVSKAGYANLKAVLKF